MQRSHSSATIIKQLRTALATTEMLTTSNLNATQIAITYVGNFQLEQRISVPIFIHDQHADVVVKSDRYKRAFVTVGHLEQFSKRCGRSGSWEAPIAGWKMLLAATRQRNALSERPLSVGNSICTEVTLVWSS